MLRFFWTTAAVVWIVVGIVQLVSLAPTSTGRIPAPQNNQETAQTPDNNDHPSFLGVVSFAFGDFVSRYKDHITSVSTALLTIITGILGWVARSQYTTTQKQLRAYVMV